MNMRRPFARRRRGMGEMEVRASLWPRTRLGIDVAPRACPISLTKAALVVEDESVPNHREETSDR